jgi:NADH-quinone oxidoreductase subunit K
MLEYQSYCLSAILFAIGILGVLINRKNLITILISIEIILLAANINFVASSSIQKVEGYIFALMTLTVAAAEAAVGLAILIVYFRNAHNINVTKINRLKG